MIKLTDILSEIKVNQPIQLPPSPITINNEEEFKKLLEKFIKLDINYRIYWYQKQFLDHSFIYSKDILEDDDVISNYRYPTKIEYSLEKKAWRFE